MELVRNKRNWSRDTRNRSGILRTSLECWSICVLELVYNNIFSCSTTQFLMYPLHCLVNPKSVMIFLQHSKIDQHARLCSEILVLGDGQIFLIWIGILCFYITCIATKLAQTPEAKYRKLFLRLGVMNCLPGRKSFVMSPTATLVTIFPMAT